MFELTININRSIATVFARLADVEAAPGWYSAVTAVARLSAGPIGRDSRYRFTRDIAGRKVENVVEVTEFVEVRGLRCRASVGQPRSPIAIVSRSMERQRGSVLRERSAVPVSADQWGCWRRSHPISSKEACGRTSTH